MYPEWLTVITQVCLSIKSSRSISSVEISIFVLLGVSIIIYTLVRMMPNDYLDIKFSSQLQQGTITQEQLQLFKEQYGIGDSSFKG